MAEHRTMEQESRRMRPGRRVEDVQLVKQADEGGLFRTLIESAGNGIVGLAPDGCVLVWSRGAEKLLGYSEREAAGAGITKLLDFDHDWWNCGASRWEGSQRHRNGRPIEVAIESSAVLDDGGQEPLGFVWIMRDVTVQARSAYQLQLREARLQREARTDPLTGAANRRGLEEVLHAEVSRAKRHSSSLSLLMVDLDNFKSVNDQHGHLYGDAVLKVFAEVVQMQLRAYNLLARFGGDEFVVLMPNADRDEADACARRLRGALDKATVPNFPHQLSASYGIAEYRDDESPDTLLRRADQALYKAKQYGRGCAVNWEDMR